MDRASADCTRPASSCLHAQSYSIDKPTLLQHVPPESQVYVISTQDEFPLFSNAAIGRALGPTCRQMTWLIV
jgi:hypothetical protein